MHPHQNCMPLQNALLLSTSREGKETVWIDQMSCVWGKEALVLFVSEENKSSNLK